MINIKNNLNSDDLMTNHLTQTEVARCLEDLDHDFETGRSKVAPLLSFIERHEAGEDRPDPEDDDDNQDDENEHIYNVEQNEARMIVDKEFYKIFEFAEIFFEISKTTTTQGGASTGAKEEDQTMVQLMRMMLADRPNPSAQACKIEPVSSSSGSQQKWWKSNSENGQAFDVRVAFSCTRRHHHILFANFIGKFNHFIDKMYYFIGKMYTDS